jgi:hypothetical protein
MRNAEKAARKRTLGFKEFWPMTEAGAALRWIGRSEGDVKNGPESFRGNIGNAFGARVPSPPGR